MDGQRQQEQRGRAGVDVKNADPPLQGGQQEPVDVQPRSRALPERPADLRLRQATTSATARGAFRSPQPEKNALQVGDEGPHLRAGVAEAIVAAAVGAGLFAEGATAGGDCPAQLATQLDQPLRDEQVRLPQHPPPRAEGHPHQDRAPLPAGLDHRPVTVIMRHNQLMLRFGRIGSSVNLWRRVGRGISTVADPYYILGVEKGATFPQVKKAFYVLAREFHPDKNDSQESQQKFIVIKQAFEAIKMERGLVKPQQLYSTSEQASMRPHPEKYATEEDEQHHSFTDYTMSQEKAQTREEFMTFNASFRTIKDINEVKFKVEEGEMADPTSRFGLERFRARISSYSETGHKHTVMVIVGLGFFSMMANQLFNDKQQQEQENSLLRLTRIHQRKTIESDLLQNRMRDLKSIEENPAFRELKKKELKEQGLMNLTGGQILKDRVLDTTKINSV